MTDNIVEILNDYYYDRADGVLEAGLSNYRDVENREKAAQALLDRLLSLPELQDEEIGQVHREFNRKAKNKFDTDIAYGYAGGMINGRNHLRRQIRAALQRELGTEPNAKN